MDASHPPPSFSIPVTTLHSLSQLLSIAHIHSLHSQSHPLSTLPYFSTTPQSIMFYFKRMVQSDLTLAERWLSACRDQNTKQPECRLALIQLYLNHGSLGECWCQR